MFSYSDIMRRYMDALKFAFEILVVGALALPWIMVLVWMFPDPASGKQRDILKFFQPFSPVGARPAVTAVALVAIGYLLGSAVSRISRDFFNDELWGVFLLKTRFATACTTTSTVRSRCSVVSTCRTEATGCWTGSVRRSLTSRGRSSRATTCYFTARP